MKYILIGTLLSSFIHSEHETRELCEGRAVLLREKGASVKCVDSPVNSGIVYGVGTGATLVPCCSITPSITGTCGPCR